MKSSPGLMWGWALFFFLNFVQALSNLPEFVFQSISTVFEPGFFACRFMISKISRRSKTLPKWHTGCVVHMAETSFAPPAIKSPSWIHISWGSKPCTITHPTSSHRAASNGSSSISSWHIRSLLSYNKHMFIISII